MAINLEQTFPRGFTEESVQAAIDAIPEGFYDVEKIELPRPNAASVPELGIEPDRLDAGPFVEAAQRAREYTSRYQDGVHISFVEIAFGSLGRYLVSVGDMVIYLREGLDPLPNDKTPEPHILDQ